MLRQKTIHGVTIGILMVNTGFQRFPGDVGNAETWSFPVQYRIVEESNPRRMTGLHQGDRTLLAPFKAAAKELAAAGVDGIATSCGFLALYQQELADHCGVPVAASSLLQVPVAERLLPAGQRVGILTFDGEALRGPYLEAAGIARDTPVYGMPKDSRFVRAIKEGDPDIPFDVLEREVLALAAKMLEDEPRIGALVLECTNLAPFSAALHETFGRPVFDALTLINWFHAALKPPRFGRA